MLRYGMIIKLNVFSYTYFILTSYVKFCEPLELYLVFVFNNETDLF